MKPHRCHDSRIISFIVAALIQSAVLVPTEAEEGSLDQSSRQDEHTIDGGDLETEEARSPFAIALPPPRYEAHPSERSWRFIQGPRFVPPSPGGFSSQPSYHVRQTDQHPNLDFRINPYSNKREQEPHANPSSGARPAPSFNPYIREYPFVHKDQEFVKPQDHRGSQRPQFHEFGSFHEPATGLRAPQQHAPIRHYNVGHQLPEQRENSNYREFSNQGKINHGSHEPRESFNTARHNQSHKPSQEYDDYEGDYWHNRQQVPPITGNRHNKEHFPPIAENNPLAGSRHKVPSIFTEIYQDNENTKNDSSSRLSKNLSTLLTGTTGLKHLQEPKEYEEIHSSLNETVSKTRTTVPEHLKPTKNGDGDQYYDDLYDEFVDMYYDEISTTAIPDEEEDESSDQKTTPKHDQIDKNQNLDRPLTEPPSKFLTTSIDTTSSSLPRTTTTKLTTKLSTDEIAKESDANSSPISLSEIIQELGLSLPQFLGTLKTHGTSLKEFTIKLQAKALSKAEFRRAKGNVKKLLEILESVRDRAFKTPEKSTSSEESFNSTTKSSIEDFKDNVSSKGNITSSTTTEKIIPKSSRPLVFGSGASGIMFSKSKNINITELIDNNARNDTSNTNETKPPLSIDLDISQIVQEKGISPADILQDFNKMFNISDTKTSTESSEVNQSTTVSLRPYKSGAERDRPYRPVDFERGNRNIHRGIINNRLSSTDRPTLRPPYSPKPPSINYGETDDGTNIEFISKNEETPHLISRDSSSSKRNNKYEELYNIGKTSPENLDVSTRSAIMAAGILGGVALSVFIAIFIVVKYRNHVHRNRRRIPLTLPSDSSSSSLPPIYASRSAFGKEAYETSGFWTTLKKRFDPYSTSSSPTSM